MIKVRLQGGLGNQMFQYALGRTIALRRNTKLLLDTSFYDMSLNRKFELGAFNIEAQISKSSFTDKVKDKLGLSKIITENANGYDSTILNSPDGSTISGDWWCLSEKYFKENRNLLLEEFSLKDDLEHEALSWKNKIQSSESVSVHLRRTDYLQSKHSSIFNNLGLEYYSKAADMISKKTKEPVFYIFSDDIAWVKENIKLPFPTELVSSGKMNIPEELTLMSLCKHNIIANSTFSWWGAWLNRNNNKIVIAPKKWFINGKSSEDMIPENWTQI